MMAQKHRLIVPGLEGAAVQDFSIRPALPKIKNIVPFGSKILVEVLRNDEIIGSKIFVGDHVNTGDGAPQALIIKLGPNVDPTSGLKEGQRVYWTGKGTAVNDPSTKEGRTRALLEISNIIAIIEEEN
jgi:hypothetical protein